MIQSGELPDMTDNLSASMFSPDIPELAQLVILNYLC